MYESIKYIVVDVDGTMTDGGIYYDDSGDELKKFCTKDAVGYFTAHRVGIKILVLTGRECPATTRRLNEMKVDFLFQGITSKYIFLQKFMLENNIYKSEIAYIGDDLNDYRPMQLTDFIGCPADACDEVKKISDYVSSVKGGYGAVRDIISFLLKQRNEWDFAIKDLFD